MKQSPILAFESGAFAVEKGEDERTNPGIFGKALAAWLAAELRAAGRRTEEAIAEDFGWCIPVEAERCRLYVACASADDEPGRWRVFAFAERYLLSRLHGKDRSDDALASLFESLETILRRSPHVRSLREAFPSTPRGSASDDGER